MNLGVAMLQLERNEEAYEHWNSALRHGSFENALQAAQRFAAADARDKLPHTSEVDFLFGEALSRAGRTREAALQYAAAHRLAKNLTDSGSAGKLRTQVKDRMDQLARVWNEGEGAVVRPTKKPAKPADIELTEATADGSTRKMKMTPEMMEQLKQMKGGS